MHPLSQLHNQTTRGTSEAGFKRNLLWGFANNKGADQPAYLDNLISTIVICLLESIISKLAISEISIFLVVAVAEQAGLGMTRGQVLSSQGPYQGWPSRPYSLMDEIKNHRCTMMAV